jgi:hypothetical protein
MSVHFKFYIILQSIRVTFTTAKGLDDNTTTGSLDSQDKQYRSHTSGTFDVRIKKHEYASTGER